MPAPLNLDQEMLMALRNGRWDRAGRLLIRGASPRATGRYGETALHHLARCLRSEREGEEQLPSWAVRMIEGGASLNALGQDGCSALTRALGLHPDLAILLLEHGADPNAGTGQGQDMAQSAVASSIRNGHEGVLDRLIAAGYDLHRTSVPVDNIGRTLAARTDRSPDAPVGLLERLAYDGPRGWDPLLPAAHRALARVLEQGLFERAGPARCTAALQVVRTHNLVLLPALERWALRRATDDLPVDQAPRGRRL